MIAVLDLSLVRPSRCPWPLAPTGCCSCSPAPTTTRLVLDWIGRWPAHLAIPFHHLPSPECHQQGCGTTQGRDQHRHGLPRASDRPAPPSRGSVMPTGAGCSALTMSVPYFRGRSSGRLGGSHQCFGQRFDSAQLHSPAPGSAGSLAGLQWFRRGIRRVTEACSVRANP